MCVRANKSVETFGWQKHARSCSILRVSFFSYLVSSRYPPNFRNVDLRAQISHENKKKNRSEERMKHNITREYAMKTGKSIARNKMIPTERIVISANKNSKYFFGKINYRANFLSLSVCIGFHNDTKFYLLR